MTDLSAARNHMVDSQLRPNRVIDPRIAEAMRELPRERFVPKLMQAIAYIDEDIEIAPGRFLMEPMVLGRLLQAADIQAGDAVLDVGCATGYSSAVLARLAGVVVALEQDEDLAARASELFTDLGVDNAAVVTGPLTEGYAKQSPYDVIFLGGAVDEVPQALVDQLADGGRLLAVVRRRGQGKAVIVSREDGVTGEVEIFDANIPVLPGFERVATFEF
jgi:protein-L-isoaspartate(D-aspartate) O-methyltransferase